MTNSVIAFFVGAGGAAWVYSKLMRSTGSNTKSALIGGIITGMLLFGLTLIVLGFVPDPI